jgi:hypothetical protein
MSNFHVDPQITIEEGVGLYSAKMQQAMATLDIKGFSMPRPPMTSGPGGAVVPYRGELPADLTTLTDQQLGTYMGLTQEWCAYVEAQLADASSNLEASKAALALIEARLRINNQKDSDGKKRSNPERDDYMGVDRRYVESRSNVLYWETMYSYIRAISKGAEGAWSSISRRITQRGQDIDRGGRTSNVTQGTNIPAAPLFGRKR